jgi:type II secretory pathway component GspD/PulD (secretin)
MADRFIFLTAPLLRDDTMTKERKSQREAKKKPGMTLKEKRSAKKSKQDAKSILGSKLA